MFTLYVYTNGWVRRVIALSSKCDIIVTLFTVPYHTVRIGFLKVFYPYIANIFKRPHHKLKKNAIKSTITGILTLCLSATSYAGLIRDTELENTLRAYTYPIVKVAGMNPKDVRLFIIGDESINAAVFGQKRMLVHTGLFLKSDTPEEIFGIIAHEMGHMKNNHVAQKQASILANKSSNTLATLAGVVAGVASGDGGSVFGALALGQHIALREHLQYSRSKEKVADLESIKYLELAKISPRGVLTIQKKMSALYGNDLNPYLMSHPTPKNRARLGQEAMENSPYANSHVDESYRILLKRAKAKIIGHTYGLEKTLLYYPLNVKSNDAVYARSMAWMIAGDYKKAHEAINHLLSKSPNDPFYIETKADIYRHQNQPKNALDWYNKAIKIMPWAGLLRNNVADILLKKAQSDDVNNTQKRLLANRALEHLKNAYRTEKENDSVLKNMALSYNILGNRGLSSWASAERYFILGDFDLAMRHATLADKIIQKFTPEKIRIKDIINAIATIQGAAQQ